MLRKGNEVNKSDAFTVAALFVEECGIYSKLSYIDLWGISRDARNYVGPYPVIAHPPCQRWGKMWMGSPSYVAKTGIRKKKGDDGGCFESALKNVRKYGGVLEHPYQSHAWPWFGLSNHHVMEVGLKLMIMVAGRVALNRDGTATGCGNLLICLLIKPFAQLCYGV